MKRLLLTVTIMASTLCACSAAPAPQTNAEKLNVIADKCGLARSTFRLMGNDRLQFMPPPSSSYESVDCALGELKRQNFPLKMGFVGNEAFQPEKK